MGGIEVPCIRTAVAVVGSGTASLNGAVHCRRMGVEDVVIVTERMGAGTSANTGSDKQTYFRLNPGSSSPDSVMEMARDLFNGQCMHGDMALVESALSGREFFHLVELGVGFPHNRYGEYAGYLTDHDQRGRGTSAGPRTSIMMYEKLSTEVKRLGIPVLEKYMVIEILADNENAGKVVRGLLAIDKTRLDDPGCGLVLIEADYVIYGTGGPGALYRDSVYPHSQVGSLGIALKAGARAHNLTENQFGISSTKVRWNLSGSYQQVIPRYISTDNEGRDEREFLNEYFPDAPTQLTALFLKGYQWPFDVRKITGYGSSLVDVLVFYEQKIKKRRVFIDFRHNPSIKGFNFTTEDLPELVREYLENSGATAHTPVERLKQMNHPAYKLYLEKGIDLEKEPLEIAVCHQHMNGGLATGIWWESNIRNFFPVGECCGTHGVYRPGGSALNSGQVGSLRAAECIAWRYNQNMEHDKVKDTNELNQARINRTREYLDRVLNSEGKLHPVRERETLQALMSSCMGIFRDPVEIHQALEQCNKMLEQRHSMGVGGKKQLIMFLQNLDLLITARAYLTAALQLLPKLRSGRGSYLVGSRKKWEDLLQNSYQQWLDGLNCDDPEGDFIQEISADDNLDLNCSMVPVRPVPEGEVWFERVWKKFRDGEYFKMEE